MYTSRHNKVLPFSLVAGVLIAGLASQGTVAQEADNGFRFVGNELGWVYAPHQPESERSRAIKSALSEGSSDSGFRFVGGELGWIYAPDEEESVRSRTLKLSLSAASPDSGFRLVRGELGSVYDPK